MVRLFSSLAFVSVLAAALPPAQGDAYRSSIERWRTDQEKALRADDGWLSVVGLTWLEPGANLAGSDEKAAVRLPASAPRRLGVFTLQGANVVFEPTDESVRIDGRREGRTVLRADDERPAHRISSGSLTLMLIRRGDKVGVRVRDRDSEARQNFEGRRWYPVQETWRITARFVSYDQPRTIPIVNVLGQVSHQPAPGYAVFAIDGREYRLEPTGEPGGTLFFNFRDATSGDGTYPAGRFLYADRPAGGRVVLDFNKAENPPCAFSEHATCPLPPRQNNLKVRVEAGEKYLK